MLDKIKQHPTVATSLQQLDALPERDKLALKALVAVLFLVILYFAMWVPAQSFMAEHKSSLESNQELLGLVEQNKNVLRLLGRGATTSKPSLDGQQLVAAVTNMAKKQGVQLKRFEPGGDNSVKIWIEKASFDKTMSWLTQLNKNLGVTVKQIALEADEEPGIVNARMTLGS